MTRRDNPNDSEIVDIKRRLRELETQSPVGSTSVTSGALRVASNEGLLVEGSAKVSGWLVVTGTLKGTGTFDWSGDLILSGSQHVTGPTVFDGPLTVNGSWQLVGNGQILGDVEILGAGKLRVGNMIIDPAGGGSVTFPGGAKVQADPSGGVRLFYGDAVVNASSVTSIRKGNSSVIVGEGGVTINPAGDGDIDMLGTVVLDRSTIPSVTVAGMPAGMLMIDSAGYLQRTA